MLLCCVQKAVQPSKNKGPEAVQEEGLPGQASLSQEQA